MSDTIKSEDFSLQALFSENYVYYRLIYTNLNSNVCKHNTIYCPKYSMAVDPAFKYCEEITYGL